MTKNNNPEVRFSGYTEEWKEKELGKILTERNLLQKITEDAPILAFASGQGVIDRSERKSNNRDHLTHDQENKIYKLTELDDIVYNPSNLKYGAIDRNKHGRGVISPIYVTFTTEAEPSFIELIVKSEKFKLSALRYEEGTVVKRQSVNPEDLLSLKVNISPSKEEQKKIGDLFKNLDETIGLYQTKHEKIIQLRESFLEKMFPKKGDLKPEIRIAGFEENWIEKSLDEIVDFSKGNGLSWNEVVESGENKCILYGNLFTHYTTVIKDVIFFTDKCKEKMTLSKDGDVLIPSSSTTPRGIEKATCIQEDGVVLGGDINILRPKSSVLGSFLAFNINSNSPKFIPLIKGTTIKHLYNSDLKNIVLLIPKKSKEQYKISEFLKNIDNLVDKYLYQINKLKNIKKSCWNSIYSELDNKIT